MIVLIFAMIVLVCTFEHAQRRWALNGRRARGSTFPITSSSSATEAAYCARHANLVETGPLSQGVQAGGQALRIRHINCMEVRKKRTRGFKKRPRGFK